MWVTHSAPYLEGVEPALRCMWWEIRRARPWRTAGDHYWDKVERMLRTQITNTTAQLVFSIQGELKALLNTLLLLLGHSVMSCSLWAHRLQHAWLPCPSPSPGTHSNSCVLSQWCHPTISSSVPFSSCLQSFPASGSFLMSWCFTSGGQSIGASASVLPMNIQISFL